MFQALEDSLEVIRMIRGPVARLRLRDRALWEQIRGAASSVTLNLAEGRGRTGADRVHLWRVAAGSAQELRAALRVAMAWGDLEEAQVAGALQVLDRVLAILWRLTR